MIKGCGIIEYTFFTPDYWENNKQDMPENALKEKRYCTIENSIIQSLKEVQLMREGKIPKRSWKDLLDKIEIWKNTEQE